METISIQMANDDDKNTPDENKRMSQAAAGRTPNDEEVKPQAPSKKEQFEILKSQISIGTFLKPFEPPWILVDHGSLLGFFDYVPYKLRNGPWSTVALLVFSALMYAFALLSVWMFYLEPSSKGSASGDAWVKQFLNNLDDDDNGKTNVWTMSWLYNLAGFVWTVSVSWNTYHKSPIGGYAFTTFTFWSWMLISLRHGLCAMVPFFETTKGDNTTNNNESSVVLYMVEMLRFPVLSTATIVFVVWNFILMPVILFLVKDSEKRRALLGYFFNRRLLQVHVGNIFAATLNGALVGPRRLRLGFGDLYISLSITVVYMIWYYFVLDRVGVHFYPIFSPRTPWVVAAWGMIFLGYIGAYSLWNSILGALAANDRFDFNTQKLLMVIR
jgi:hypothetical protein